MKFSVICFWFSKNRLLCDLLFMCEVLILCSCTKLGCAHTRPLGHNNIAAALFTPNLGVVQQKPTHPSLYFVFALVSQTINFNICGKKKKLRKKFAFSTVEKCYCTVLAISVC